MADSDMRDVPVCVPPAGDNPGDGVKVRIGPLLIDVNDRGFGPVLYDGKRVPLVGFTVHVQAGKPVRVTLEPST